MVNQFLFNYITFQKKSKVVLELLLRLASVILQIVLVSTKKSIPGTAALHRECSYEKFNSYFFSEMRMEISKHFTEWVSAPREMMSTPVSAMPRMVSAVTLPDASSITLPFTRCTALVISSQLILSSIMISAPAESASSSSSSVRTSTSIFTM